MNSPASPRRPYLRPMRGWWKRDPFFIGYMAMEATSILVAVYALTLLVGIARLAAGETAYTEWLAAMRSPGAIVFHVLVFAVFVYHAWSWFRIMPKTLPMIVIGGKRVEQRTIQLGGVAAAVVVNLAVLVLLAWVCT